MRKTYNKSPEQIIKQIRNHAVKNSACLEGINIVKVLKEMRSNSHSNLFIKHSIQKNKAGNKCNY